MKDQRRASRVARIFLVLGVPLLVLLVSGHSQLSAQDPDHWNGQTESHHIHEPSESEPLNIGPLYGVPCIAGFAGPFPCKDVDLLAYIPSNLLAASTGADIWGWTDSETGKEYAVVAHSNAVSFVDISTPTVPVYLGYLPAPATNVLWRDVKVYNNHAYAVGDGDFGGPHGLQIFDLTQLRDASAVPTVFEQTAHYAGFGNAHNLSINEETGTAYVVGSNTCSGGPHMLSLANPTNPQFLGCYADEGYTHDIQCVIYHGPDKAYHGHEICFAANPDTLALTIIDMTDKSAPQLLGRMEYEGSEYTHQGSLTEDHAYFLLGDELDEFFNLHNTHTYLWDVRDLNNPVHFSTYVGPTTAIDHNLYVRGNYVYETNYTAGLRILDATTIATGSLDEVAYFDTHPSDDLTVFAGTWSNYPFFESGVVIVNNIEDGLFIVKPRLQGQAPEGTKASGSGSLTSDNGERIDFSLVAQVADGQPSGKLQVNDRATDIRISASDMTFIGEATASCGSISAGPNALEFHVNGRLNGVAASFRVCVQDNGRPGEAADQFFVACKAGCDYNSSTSSSDDRLDSGNIKVRWGAAEEDGGDSEVIALILDPLLATEANAGEVQLFSVTVYDSNHEVMAGAPVTLTRTAADGTVTTFTATTDTLGVAAFDVVNLAQPATFTATSGGVQSNSISLDSILP